MSCSKCGDCGNDNPNPLNSCDKLGCDNPCGNTSPTNSAACETLPSQIDNFTLQFFGEVVKTEVDGKVVWSLPCELDQGLPANPRGADEPLGCYILRLFEDGIIGEQGPKGDTGDAGTNGVDAYTVVNAPFATPSLEHPYVQIVTRLNANIVTGANIFIEDSGWYNVVGTDGTGVLFCNLISRLSDAVAIVPVGALVVPAGQTGVGTKGATGDKGLTGDQGIQGPKGQPGNDAVSVTQNNGFFFTTTGNDYDLLAFTDEDFHPVWFSVAAPPALPGYPPPTPTAADPRFTLPNAGTYLIVGKTAANVQSNVQIKLFSVTNNFDVPGTQQQISPSAANEFRHCPFAAIYTAGGADTIQLYASRILGFMDGGLAGANNTVYDIAVQPDGKILVAGVFTQMNATSICGIARLNVDGTVDTSFNPTGTGVNAGAIVYSVGIMADGHIVIGGNFSSYKDSAAPAHSVSKLAILNSDGTLHTDLVTSHPVINDTIFALDIDANNMAVITGAFTTVGGTTRRRIARIQTSGGPGTTGFLDTTFGTNTSGLNDVGRAVKVLANGLVMVGGAFTATQKNGGSNALHTQRIGRFDNTTGLPDETWASTTASQFNSTVFSIEEQTVDVPTTGQIICGGSFSTYNGTSSPKFIQLTAAGAVATASAGFNNDVHTVSLDTTGNIVVGGLFTKFGPATTNQNHLSRIVPGTGALDTSLGDVNIGVVADIVYSASVQTDTKILIGGTFIAVQTIPRGRVARLLTDGTLNTVPSGRQNIPYLYTDITWTQIA